MIGEVEQGGIETAAVVDDANINEECRSSILYLLCVRGDEEKSGLSVYGLANRMVQYKFTGEKAIYKRGVQKKVYR